MQRSVLIIARQTCRSRPASPDDRQPGSSTLPENIYGLLALAACAFLLGPGTQVLNQIAPSITEFGWTNPILVDEHDGVIARHAKLLAAQKLGIQEVPVIVLGHLSEDQRRALVIADNQACAERGMGQGTALAPKRADRRPAPQRDIRSRTLNR